MVKNHLDESDLVRSGHGWLGWFSFCMICGLYMSIGILMDEWEGERSKERERAGDATEGDETRQGNDMDQHMITCKWNFRMQAQQDSIHDTSHSSPCFIVGPSLVHRPCSGEGEQSSFMSRTVNLMIFWFWESQDSRSQCWQAHLGCATGATYLDATQG